MRLEVHTAVFGRSGTLLIIQSYTIDELVRRLAVRKIKIVVEDAVLEKLLDDGVGPLYGARPLRREVEREPENPLAMKIVAGEYPDGSQVQVQVRNGQIRFRVEKSSSGSK